MGPCASPWSYPGLPAVNVGGFTRDQGIVAGTSSPAERRCAGDRRSPALGWMMCLINV